MSACLIVTQDKILGEHDVEYAEFSMTQRMLLREPSPANACAGLAGALSPTNLSSSSFEDYVRSLQLFDIPSSPAENVERNYRRKYFLFLNISKITFFVTIL